MKRVPIGVEDFKELISNNYYVDKSELIKDIINEKVVLYTRPRRFGKTLNMSM
ncbi:AAA family ATPase, partial [Thomasclavelia cocleata]